jgi:predicted nucleic acid-binding protein
MTEPRIIVVTDASVLINFLHMRRQDILGALPGHRVVVPDHVVDEVLRPEQGTLLAQAFGNGTLERMSISDLGAMGLYAELVHIMGRGEASCIALASSNNWLVACDERGLVRRVIIEKLGEGRLLNTAGILVLAIRAGLLTIEEADRLKGILGHRRFKLKFKSFREVVGRVPGEEPDSQ